MPMDLQKVWIKAEVGIVNHFKYPPDTSLRSDQELESKWRRQKQIQGGEGTELKSKGKEEIEEKLLLLWKNLHFKKCLNMLNVIIKPTNENSYHLNPEGRNYCLNWRSRHPNTVVETGGQMRWLLRRQANKAPNSKAELHQVTTV